MSLRVLVAEDEPVTRALLMATLSRWGYEVQCVGSGHDAWEALATSHFDILLSDWEMPGGDGPELCARIRQRESSAPIHVILLTSRDRADDIALGLKAGADDFVTKPFNPVILRARIEAGRRIVELRQSLSVKIADANTANSALEVTNSELNLSHRHLQMAMRRLVQVEKLSLAARLSGTVAHEILGPLSVILGNLGYLRRCAEKGQMNAKDDLVSTIDDIEEGIHRIENLTIQIQQFQPILPEESSSVDVSGIVSRVLAAEKDCDFETELAEAPQASVQTGDLEEALRNLIAFLRPEYDRPSKALALRVRVGEEGGRPCIHVEDRELEMSENERQLIFDPRIGRDGPAGQTMRMQLGLSLALQAILRNNGELTADPAVPCGTSFRIGLAPASAPSATSVQSSP